MKILFITGSHPRHAFVAKTLYEAGLLSSIIVETREEFIPMPPLGIIKSDENLFNRHFEDRERSEYRAFGSIDHTRWEIPTLKVETSELNSLKVKERIIELNPDIVISYGVHKLSEDLLDVFPVYSWNIHGGLSPWYRGNTTLFWPFYFLKPNWSGMTIHRLTSQLDGGGIIHHSVPQLEHGDGIHDVACKAVKQVALDLVTILKLILSGGSVEEVPQKSSGKLFTSIDWEPHHLRVIYEQFNNDIVDHYLNGLLGNSQPRLVRAFE